MSDQFEDPQKDNIIITAEPIQLDSQTSGFDPKALALTIGAIVTNIVGVLVVIKVIPADASGEINNAVGAILGALVTVCGNVALIVRYFRFSENKADLNLRSNVLRAYQSRRFPMYGTAQNTPAAVDEIALLRSIMKSY